MSTRARARQSTHSSTRSSSRHSVDCSSGSSRRARLRPPRASHSQQLPAPGSQQPEACTPEPSPDSAQRGLRGTDVPWYNFAEAIDIAHQRYHAWYRKNASKMTPEEREECDFSHSDLMLGRAAWRQPCEHKLLKAVVSENTRDLFFGTFLALRFLYVDCRDEYRTLNVPPFGPRTGGKGGRNFHRWTFTLLFRQRYGHKTLRSPFQTEYPGHPPPRPSNWPPLGTRRSLRAHAEPPPVTEAPRPSGQTLDTLRRKMSLNEAEITLSRATVKITAQKTEILGIDDSKAETETSRLKAENERLKAKNLDLQSQLSASTSGSLRYGQPSGR